MIPARAALYAANGGLETSAYADRVCGDRRAHPATQSASAEQLLRKVRRLNAAGSRSGYGMSTHGHPNWRNIRKPDAAQEIRKPRVGPQWVQVRLHVQIVQVR